MKDPCESCPKVKTCKDVCVQWIEWLFTKTNGRNSVQMRITQYTEREE